MPWLIWGLVGILARFLPVIVAKLLLAIGIGYVTYMGTWTAVVFWRDYGLQSMTANMPVDLIKFAAFLELEKCIAIMMGGVSVRILLAGWSSGSRLGRIAR